MEYKTPIGAMEDLMREHGLLNRVLLIYEEIARRLAHNEVVSMVLVHDAATIVREFIEDYHEKMEEKYVFPRLQQAGILPHMVDELLVQHQLGRMLTDTILTLARPETSSKESDKQRLLKTLQEFTIMYRAHESREDTEIFPPMHALLSPAEYDALGEEFERTEHELLGEHGFSRLLKKVMSIEQELGIFDLEHYTKEAESGRK